MVSSLTLQQKKIYLFYKKFYEKHGLRPTYLVTSRNLGISLSEIVKDVRLMKNLGLLPKDYHGISKDYSLTQSQKRVYDFYKNFYREHGTLPTYTVASERLGISAPAIFKQVRNLQAHGYLGNDKFGNVYFDNDQVRIIGYISSGGEIDFIEKTETISLPKKMIKPHSKYYALIVKGDGMMYANIQDGDILVIKQVIEINSGEIGIVIDNDGGVSLKRVFKRAGDILLNPEKNDFSSILSKDCEIRGQLVGLIREFK